MSYKKWKNPWRLHAKTQSEDWDLIGDKYFKWKFLGALLLIFTLAFYSHPTSASSYGFPYSDRVTMDVVKNDGSKGGGTYICPSFQSCYVKVLEVEARGAAMYCESITIKRDGKVVWYRNYQNPSLWSEER